MHALLTQRLMVEYQDLLSKEHFIHLSLQFNEFIDHYCLVLMGFAAIILNPSLVSLNINDKLLGALEKEIKVISHISNSTVIHIRLTPQNTSFG